LSPGGGLHARRRALHGLVAGLGATLLAGCASRPPDPAEGWTSGRLALRVDADTQRAAQSLSALFELRGDDRSGELRLATPLGTRLAEARWAPGLVMLSSARGEQRYDSLEGLAAETLGEPLPLQVLPDWLAGRPWPGAPARASEAGFEQLGWAVDLREHPQGRLSARRAALPAVLLVLRLDRPD
jgi:outer membrane lipoprotein LolB